MDILTAMRCWIGILLMIVLPLQLSWAVAANYCQDGQDQHVRHFGHHVDLNHSGVDAAKKLVQGKQQADRDCGCSGHLCGAYLLPSGIGVLPDAPRGQQLNAVVPRTYCFLDPPRIERPNWSASL